MYDKSVMVLMSTDLRPGMTVESEGNVWQVLKYEHIKVAQGKPTIRVKWRNLKTGSVQERSFKGGDKFDQAHIDRKEMQFLYSAKDEHVFMDQESYEQLHLSGSHIDEAMPYLKEGAVVPILFYESQPVLVDLPAAVELKIVETDPGLRGDTASGGSKPAKLETGLTVNVPLFIGQGEVIKIDTRDNKYLSRA